MPIIDFPRTELCSTAVWLADDVSRTDLHLPSTSRMQFLHALTYSHWSSFGFSTVYCRFTVRAWQRLLTHQLYRSYRETMEVSQWGKFVNELRPLIVLSARGVCLILAARSLCELCKSGNGSNASRNVVLDAICTVQISITRGCSECRLPQNIHRCDAGTRLVKWRERATVRVWICERL